MKKLLFLAIAIGCCSSMPANGQDDSVPEVEARAKWSSNAAPIEHLTPDIIRSRLATTQAAAVAAGRRPEPPPVATRQPMALENAVAAGESRASAAVAQPMTMEEIRAFVVMRNQLVALGLGASR